MKFYIKRRHRKWNLRDRNITKTLILKALSTGPKQTHEICELVMVSEDSILPHLNGYSQKRKEKAKGLVEKGHVKMKCYGKYNIMVWEITQSGKNLLKASTSIKSENYRRFPK